MQLPRFSLVIGMDFSGAALAGKKIWLCLARPSPPAQTAGLLLVEQCLPASGLPGGDSRREPALAALVTWLAAQAADLPPGHAAAVGCDFPFGLHHSLAGKAGYPGFLRDFTRRFADPEAFRAACAEAGTERALKRACDLKARTPFAAHNLRMYRQSWYGMARVLAPLVLNHGAAVPPCHLPQPAPGLWLLETCPASTVRFRIRGEKTGAEPALIAEPYKGGSARHLNARRMLLDWLIANGLRLPDAAMEKRVLEDAEGDALDSLLAAWACWQATSPPAELLPASLLPRVPPQAALEGWVYW